MMRVFSRRGAVTLCAVWAVLLISWMRVETASAADPKISLLWSLAALTGPEDQRTLISLESDSVLNSGDKFKMMFQAEQRCHVYLIFIGAGGEMLMLHPPTLDTLNRPVEPAARVYIPDGGDWFILDRNSGRETLYLLVSSEPLTDLETELQRYHSAKQEHKAEIAQAVVELIERHEMYSRPLTASAERPLVIGGTIRGVAERPVTPEDIYKLAEKIEADDLFVRTYSIDHR